MNQPSLLVARNICSERADTPEGDIFPCRGFVSRVVTDRNDTLMGGLIVWGLSIKLVSVMVNSVMPLRNRRIEI